MYWVADNSDSIESRKWAYRVQVLLDRKADETETVTRSRYLGAALQFFNPSGYLGRREQQLDEQLEQEGVSIGESQLPTLNNENNYFEDVNANLVSKYEFDRLEEVDHPSEAEHPAKRRKVSVPESVKEATLAEVDELENYSQKQLVRYVSNCVLAFDASTFTCLAERVETKEQLLKEVRGETVEKPTPVFEEIRDGELFEVLQADVFGREEMVESLSEIDPEDDVVLEDGHPVHEQTWGEDGLDIPKSGGRAGVFMGYFRGLVEKLDGDGFPQIFFLNHIDAKTDYTPSYVFEEYLSEHLTEGSDGDWYVFEENAPVVDEEENERQKEARKMEVARDVRSLAMQKGQSRDVKPALRNFVGSGAPESVKTVGSSVKDATALAEVCGLNELESIRDYLIEGVDVKEAGRKLDTVDPDYIQENFM